MFLSELLTGTGCGAIRERDRRGGYGEPRFPCQGNEPRSSALQLELIRSKGGRHDPSEHQLRLRDIEMSRLAFGQLPPTRYRGIAAGKSDRLDHPCVTL